MCTKPISFTLHAKVTLLVVLADAAAQALFALVALLHVLADAGATT
jgi:hypothetical protein